MNIVRDKSFLIQERRKGKDGVITPATILCHVKTINAIISLKISVQRYKFKY